MAVRRESRWWVATLGVVAALVAISLLAMDRPNVVWSGGRPLCPSCRAEVRDGSTRCAQCTTSFDWTVSAPEESPLCSYDLSALEAEYVHHRVRALGQEVAAERVAKALSITKESASAYLAELGRGRCGYCGGRGTEPNGEGEVGPACRACDGSGKCAGCGGDHIVTLGSIAAARAYETWRAQVADLPEWIPVDAVATEHARLTREFLARHAGTLEAHDVTWPAKYGEATMVVVGAARARLDDVRAALEDVPAAGDAGEGGGGEAGSD